MTDIAQSSGGSTLARIAASRFFTFSLLMHLLLVLLGGGVVVFERVTEPPDFTAEGTSFLTEVAAPPTPPVEEVAMPTEAPAPPVPTAPALHAMDVSAIVSTAPTAAFSMSAPTVSTVGDFSQKLAEKVSKVGVPTTAGTKTDKPFGTMFGQRVEAEKLGVILDVSGSTHSVLPEVIAEVLKNFAKAETVLVTGCGMKASVKDVEVFPIRKIKLDEKIPDRHPIAQLLKSKSKNEDVKELPKRLKSRQDVFYVEGGDVLATHYAFEHLIKHGVDAIYWFADFADPLEAPVVEDLAGKAVNRKIKVYIHSIAGKKPHKSVQDMAEKTGGDVMIKAPPPKKS